MPELNIAAVSGATKQASNLPTRKVIAGSFAGAVTTIGVFLLNTYLLPPDKPLTAEIAAAITTVLATVIAYVVPPAAEDQVAST
jgi:fluoride ion exporter CrcB/FEX